MVTQRLAEDHRPEEAHLQVVPGRVRRAGDHRAHLLEKPLRCPGLRSRGRTQGQFC